MKRRLLPVSILIFILLANYSCDPNRVYDEYVAVNANGWDSRESVRLVAELTDTVSLCSCYINVRNTTDYPFSNLYLFIKTIYPDGKVAMDTIQLQLADKSGKWLGKGIGKLRDNQVLLMKDIRFPYTGKYVFEISQAMRVNKLKGIKDIGMRISKQS